MINMIPFNSFKKSQVLPIREQYYQGLIFQPGSFVTDGKQKYQILECGSNYVTVRDIDCNISKKFITAIQEIHTGKNKEMNEGLFLGFKPKTFTPEITEAFEKTIEEYKIGEFDDQIALIKAMKAIDEDRTSDAFNSLKRINQTHNHTYLKEVQEMAQKQVELATQIAEKFGGEFHYTPEHTISIVLESLVNINHDSAREAAQTVIELAEEAGIVIESIKKPNSVKAKIANQSKKYWDAQPIIEPKDNKIGNAKILKTVSEAVVLEPGADVTVKTKFGQTKPGKVVFNHGTAIEVKHGNGKVSFHPHSNVSAIERMETLGKTDADQTPEIGPESQDNAPGNLKSLTDKSVVNTPNLSIAQKLMNTAKLQDVNQ